MRLLIVSDFVYPNYVGGVSRHVRDVMQEYLRRGVDVRLVTRVAGGQYRSGNADCVYEDWVKNRLVVELSGLKMLNPANYRKLVLESDVVNIHHPVMGIAAGLLSRLYGKKIFYNFHGPYHGEYLHKINKKNIHYGFCYLTQRLLLQLANKILVHSDYMRELVLAMLRSSSSRITYLPPYVDINKFKPVDELQKRELKAKFRLNDAFVVFTSRRLTKRTGVLELVKQWKKIRAKLCEYAVLVIAGTGELKGEIVGLIGEDCSVRLVGCVPDDELVELYQLSDVYLLPSLDLEGFGYVVLEAMSCGLPVCVSTRAGGGADFVRKIDAELLFDIFNVDDICRSIKLAVNKYGDVEASNFLRSISIKYSLSNLADSYLNIFAT